VAGLTTLASHCGVDTFQFEVATLDCPEAECVRRFPVPAFGLGEGNWFSRLAPTYRYSSKLIPWLLSNAQDYDCVVVNGIWDYHAIAVGKALKGLGVPYVVFNHGMLDPWFKVAHPLKHLKKQIYWSLFLGRVMRDADYLLFTAEDEMTLARGTFSGYAPRREKVVCYGPNDAPAATQGQLQAFAQLVPGLGRKPFLLFLSRIDPKKGCDLLIEAFGRIAISHGDIQLVIAGPDLTGWRGDLEKLAKSHGVADRIHWPGMLSGDAKWGAFRKAKAFILPSHQENFGIAVAEAMACGTPVLISNKINIWREIDEDKAGIVASDDVAGTTELIAQFLQLSDAEVQAMAGRARASFLSRFCGDRFASDMYNIVVELKKIYQASK